MKLFVENIVGGGQEFGDKRQKGLTVNRCIDTRVHCPTEMYIRLHLLPDRGF